METKHLTLVQEYVQAANLANVLQSSLRTLISGDSYPDNPFGVLARHMAFYSTRSDLEQLLLQVRAMELNELTLPADFGLVSVEGNPRAWGLPLIVSRVDVNRVEKLMWACQDALKDFKGKRGALNLEVMTSLGGGQIYTPKTVSVPDFSSTPLVLRAECLIEAHDFEHCFNFFSDWVYDDLIKIGASNSLHYVQDFVIEQSRAEFHSKHLTFDEFKNNKQLFVSELRSATLQRKVCYVRMMLFSLNITKNSLDELKQAPRASLKINLATDSSAELTDMFEFVPTKKIYSLQFIERRRADDRASFKSFSPVPAISLFEGIFSTRAAAERYSSLFCPRGVSILRTPALELYQTYKTERLRYLAGVCQINKCIWELFELSLINNDRNLTEETLRVIAHDGSKLISLKRRSKMLIILVEAFYDTNFPHFKKLAETEFSHLKEAFLSVFNRGSTLEFILLKPLAERMLRAVSVHGSKALNLTNDTMRILTTLQELCDCIARNNTEMLTRHCQAVLDAVTFEGVSHTELLENKNTAYVFEAGESINRSAEYLINSGVIELMTSTTRTLLLSYPLLPNPLQVYGAKLIGASAKYDMESSVGMPNRRIERISRECSTLYPEAKYQPRNLPYLVGPDFILKLTEAEEVAYFKLLYHNYEFKHIDSRSAVPPGYQLKTLSGVCGLSLFNRTLLKRQRTEWTTNLEILLKGPSFHASTHVFVDLLIQYAVWLDRSTDAVVIGFFTSHVSDKQSPNSLALQSSLVSPSDRQEAFSSILSAYQINTQVWLQFLVPFKGDSVVKISASYRSVRVLCNMHYSNGGSFLSLVKPCFFEDCCKVFFDKVIC